MKYIDINGKLIRKDPKYYLQDVLEFPEYDGTYEKLEDYLEHINEECEITIVNTKCMTEALLNVFKKYSEKSDLITLTIE